MFWVRSKLRHEIGNGRLCLSLAPGRAWPCASKSGALKKAEIPLIATTPAPEPETETCLVEKWAGETVIRRKYSFLLASELRASFEAWCQTHGLTPVNTTAFGRRMTVLGFGRKKVGGVMRYEGVALRGVWPELTVINGAKA